MRTLFKTAAVLLLCASSAQAATIHVTNSGPFDRTDMVSIERAVSKQIRRDVRPHWHVPNVTWGKSGGWTLEIDENITAACGSDYAGCHKVGANGKPKIYVLDQFDVEQTVITISHEVIEALVDPSGYGHEVCDPVYRASYPIGNWLMSDFVYPRYYRRIAMVSRTHRHKVDFMGVLR